MVPRPLKIAEPRPVTEADVAAFGRELRVISALIDSDFERDLNERAER